MEEIKTIIALVQDAGFIGLLIVLAVPKLRELFGFKNGYQPQIDALQEHARTSNEEVGLIQKDIVIIKTDIKEVAENVAYLKGKLDK